MPFQKLHQYYAQIHSETESWVDVGTSSASEFENIVTEQISSGSHIGTREDLQGLVRDLNLSIEKSAILVSQLK